MLGGCGECANGFEFLDGFCGRPVGCISYTDNFTKCIACAAKFHFVYVPANASCVCDNGYKLVTRDHVKICVAQCGDGIASLPDE